MATCGNLKKTLLLGSESRICNTRLEKEYLFRKGKETLERTQYEKKRKIRQALQEGKGKPIPTELRNEEAKLHQEINLEDENTAVPRTHIDDEYAKASERDPKILLTTSRDPSAPIIQFTKELKLVFPNAQVVNRGGQVISEIVESCRAHDYTDIVLVHEHCGKPDWFDCMPASIWTNGLFSTMQCGFKT